MKHYWRNQIGRKKWRQDRRARGSLRAKGKGQQTPEETIEAEMSKAEHKWKELEAQAQNRVQWKGVVDGLCSAGGVKRLKSCFGCM